MDSATAALLSNVTARESRSLLQYVAESYPWTTPEEQGVLARLDQLITEERQGAAALGRLLLRRRHQAPYVGQYPMSFTTINFVSLGHLLPLLIQHQRAAIRQLEQDVAQVTDPEARTQVDALLAMKQRHLTELEKMSSAVGEQPAAQAKVP